MNPRSLIVFALLAFTVNVAAQTAPADTPAKLLSAPTFVLPDDAREAGIGGKIVFTFTLDETGVVKDALPTAGPSFPCGTYPDAGFKHVFEAAQENVEASKFSPAIKDGVPVTSVVRMSVKLGDADVDYVVRKQKEAGIDYSSSEPITGKVLNGKALSMPAPTYPPEARKRKISGTVSIDLLIDEKGKVVAAGATGGPALLQPAARDAACGAKFSPTLLEGHPVKVHGTITYNFTL